MLTTILVIIVLIFVIRSVSSDLAYINPFSEKDVPEEPIVAGKFTPLTLAKFNGTDDPKIFISVRGTVYNVTQGASFYGPGGPYENFAGRDASRGLGKNSFDLENITPLDQPLDDLKDLTKEEVESLDHWEELFESKYPVVGTLHFEAAS